VKEGNKVAVAGLGGLGHMAVKLAKAMGAEVTVLTTSPAKAAAALEIGAAGVIVSTDQKAMEEAAGQFDLVVDTIPISHEIQPFVTLLRPNGTLVVLGAIAPLPGFDGFSLIFGNRVIAGSLIGGLPETQEMLDFCAAHGIVPEIEVIQPEQVNDAWATLAKGDVPHRFVIDMQSSEGAL
jgi:alcohol dehydrogenase (NADP+)